jgi:TolB-like protein/Tfp pilus assembly protein PilF
MLREKSGTSGSSGISSKAVQAQVEKILSSDLFANAGNLSRFLRFIVEQTLAGQGEHLKEYRIGVEVFGRGDRFDPKEDTIVRVQARNLRAKLANYYGSVGMKDPVIIELPKGTYAPVFRSQPVRSDQPERHRFALYLGLILVLAIAAGAYWAKHRSVRGKIQPSLLVWPFADDGSDDGASYFANGISSDLTTALASTGAVRVVRVPARLTSDESAALRSAKEFHNEFLLTGIANATNGKVRLSINLSRTADGSRIWNRKFERPSADISAVLEETVRAVLRELQINRPKRRLLLTSRISSLENYNRYHRALHLSATDAIPLLEEVVAHDPIYAPAFARLALVYANVGTHDAVAKARSAATRALQLDGNLSDGHLWRAVLLDHYDLDWNAAEREYRRALELDPSSPDAHYFYSVLLTRLGRFDEALAEIRNGEEFAPFSTGLRGQEAWTLGMQRHYEQALYLLRKQLESRPNDYNLNLFLGDIYLHKGDFERALLTLQAIESEGQRQPLVIGLEGYAHAVLGHTAEARNLLKRLEGMPTDKPAPPTCFAFIYIGLGDREAAFRRLDQALLNDRFMLSGLKVWPVYDSLHNDLRYFALLTKLGLN